MGSVRLPGLFDLSAAGSGSMGLWMLWRCRPQPGDRWHLDEVSVIDGRRQYLWRAVDQHGTVLDILVQSRRDSRAATRFFRKLLKRQQHVPRVLITGKLRSYGIAHRQVMPSVERRQSKYLNNRAEMTERFTVWNEVTGLASVA